MTCREFPFATTGEQCPVHVYNTETVTKTQQESGFFAAMKEDMPIVRQK